jgi:predicted N-acetyltransferase YhbS
VFSSVFLCEQHDLSRFDCGVPALNDWLTTDAWRANRADTARTYVWTNGGPVVVGYFAIAPTQVVRGEISRSVAGGYSVIPAFLLAKLALDKTLRGQGLGSELLVDAITRIVGAAEASGGRLIVVDAIDDAAADFYLHHDFQRVHCPSADSRADSHRLFLKMATARNLMGVS